MERKAVAWEMNGSGGGHDKGAGEAKAVTANTNTYGGHGDLNPANYNANSANVNKTMALNAFNKRKEEKERQMWHDLMMEMGAVVETMMKKEAKAKAVENLLQFIGSD